jgi:hypothetical protein
LKSLGISAINNNICNPFQGAFFEEKGGERTGQKMRIDRDSVRITDRTQPPYRCLDLSRLMLDRNFEEQFYRTGKRFS